MTVSYNEETDVAHAKWLLKALRRRSPRPISSMEPPNKLRATLSQDDTAIETLSQSMRRYAQRRNPEAWIGKADVDAAKNIRDNHRLLVKQITTKEPSDDAADAAIAEAKSQLAQAGVD